jgi:hypothetical protein
MDTNASPERVTEAIAACKIYTHSSETLTNEELSHMCKEQQVQLDDLYKFVDKLLGYTSTLFQFAQGKATPRPKRLPAPPTNIGIVFPEKARLSV